MNKQTPKAKPLGRCPFCYKKIRATILLKINLEEICVNVQIVEKSFMFAETLYVKIMQREGNIMILSFVLGVQRLF
ncbi:hypothetical protein [Snodgrassella sp. ESL0324]|uniref:hypothetical protein n=1 Tax=Snodgrassella sp. ESL0324 TaxID=2705033 RepID=UPI001581929F|nr:hypothetical protein [Snodgrassella sp. ESL0324]NUF08993.1 hypothetical protein [Snodgrassella sp. ESL0324]